MKIEELSESVFEELDGKITAVELADDLCIYFQCGDWADLEKTRKFKLICANVLESQVYPSWVCEIQFLTNHPLLWKHNKPHGDLYYSSQPNDRYEILGRLFEMNETTFGGWRALNEHVNFYYEGQRFRFCDGPGGLLASGPKPLLELFQRGVVENIQTNYVPSHKPDHGANVLLFDVSFVICQSVVVEEISN